MSYDWLKEEQQMFEIGARTTDWIEQQEMCLQKGIQDGFFEEPYRDYQQKKEMQCFGLEDFGREKD